MREIRTEIEIEAAPADVWAALTAFDAFPEWNPFVRAIQGELVEGEALEVDLEMPSGRGMTMRPTVTSVTDGRSFAWLGHVVVPGVFDGHHRFEIEPRPGERSMLVHREAFSGILAGLVLRLIGADTKAGFVAMNEALKERVEASAA